jgi:hypothetical protein
MNENECNKFVNTSYCRTKYCNSDSRRDDIVCALWICE